MKIMIAITCVLLNNVRSKNLTTFQIEPWYIITYPYLDELLEQDSPQIASHFQATVNCIACSLLWPQQSLIILIKLGDCHLSHYHCVSKLLYCWLVPGMKLITKLEWIAGLGIWFSKVIFLQRVAMI